MVKPKYVDQIIRDWRGYVNYHATASSRDGQPWVRYWGDKPWFYVWIKFRQHRSAIWGRQRREPLGPKYRHINVRYMNAFDQVGALINKAHSTRMLPPEHTYKRVIVATILSGISGMVQNNTDYHPSLHGYDWEEAMNSRISIDRWRLQRN